MSLPPEWKQAFDAFGMTMALSALGRLIWHLQQVLERKRRFWSLFLIWESLLAVGIGFFAAGVVDYLGLEGRPGLAVIILVSYLGPKGLENLMVRVGWLRPRNGGSA